MTDRPMTPTVDPAIGSDVRQWRGLVRTGAWAALASVAFIAVQIAIYLLWPPPDTAEEFFRELNDNPVVGLLMLDALYPLSNVLTLLFYGALAVPLWRVSRSAVTIALALGGVGMASFMASVRPVEMLQLARTYAEAAPAERVALAATGEGMLATWTGSAFDVYYLLNCAALLIFGLLILRSASRHRAPVSSKPVSSQPVSGNAAPSNSASSQPVSGGPVFSRATAVWGLAAAVLMAVPSNVGTVGLAFALASLVPWAVFAVLGARRLLALCREL